VVVNIAASITLYMVSHLPTVGMRCLGRTGSLGRIRKAFPRGVPGKLSLTLKERSPVVKNKMGNLEKIGRDGARTSGTAPADGNQAEIDLVRKTLAERLPGG
jgi:hypothetical protein